MAKKNRNKTRDMLSDYWKTNRQTEKENAAALKEQAAGKNEKEKKKWTRSEKAMMIVIILGLAGIFIRYAVLK